MVDGVTRRDFFNGVGLAVGAGLTAQAQLGGEAWAQLALTTATGRYPPALTGLRGHHDGSFEVAHQLRDGRRFATDGSPIEENFDLVVVGGGISGLAAAWFYRRAVGQDARILILDNHDDFGGHAKRNEFTLQGRRIIGYGGSESLQSPKSLYSPVAKALLRDLGVDVDRFNDAYDRTLYASLGLTRGLFFAREAFGHDVLVAGDPQAPEGEGALTNARRALDDIVAAMPISAQSKAQLIALYKGERDPLPGKTPDQKIAALRSVSYRDFLLKAHGCNEEVANIFQGRTLGFFGLGADAVPASDARDLGYPGFRGVGLASDRKPEWQEPYIYHFPDGNASIARLLVRSLNPSVASGTTMDEIVLAPFDYSRLDTTDHPVRIRLDSTVVNVRSQDDHAVVGYVRSGAMQRVAARHVVLACFHAVIPHIMPELPDEQRDALAQNVKAPLVYTNVVVRHWRPFVALKVSDISAPMSFHSRVKLDFPVSMGGYRHARDPSEPICLHLVHVPGEPNQGLDARAQFRLGREKLLAMTFADFEARIRDELDRMLGPGGFASGRDIAAITVNRWSHGYSYVANSLFDPDDYDAILQRARRKAGRVAIANTDAGGDAWAHYAIDHAERAVRELLS